MPSLHRGGVSFVPPEREQEGGWGVLDGGWVCTKGALAGSTVDIKNWLVVESGNDAGELLQSGDTQGVGTHRGWGHGGSGVMHGVGACREQGHALSQAMLCPCSMQRP